MIADVNDQTPKIKQQEKCAFITEFHKPGDRITIVSAEDKDDPETPNGRVHFEIVESNEMGKELTANPYWLFWGILNNLYECVFVYVRANVCVIIAGVLIV